MQPTETVAAPATARRGLRVTLAASGISMAGSAASFVAIPWLVHVTTGSASKTGLISAVAGASIVISGIVLGPAIDRFGFRRMSIILDLCAGLAVATVPILYATVGLPLWALAILVFISAAAGMASSTARQSMLPSLSTASGNSLDRVTATYWTMQRSALALAAIPTGLLIVLLGPANVLWVDAGSFLFAAVLMLTSPRGNVPGSATSTTSGYLTQLTAGLRLMRHDRLITLVLGTAVLLAALDAPLLTVILPVIADGPHGANTLGTLIFAYGLGTVAGTVGYGIIGVKLPRHALTIGCLAAIGLAYLPLILMPGTVGRVLALGVIGLAAGPLTPLIMTAVQLRIPSAMLGRVTGTLIALITATVPIGRATGGYAIDFLGLSVVLGVIAVGYLGTTTYLLISRRFRTLMNGGTELTTEG